VTDWITEKNWFNMKLNLKFEFELEFFGSFSSSFIAWHRSIIRLLPREKLFIQNVSWCARTVWLTANDIALFQWFYDWWRRANSDWVNVNVINAVEWFHAAARRLQEESHRSRRAVTQVRRVHRGHHWGSQYLSCCCSSLHVLSQTA